MTPDIVATDSLDQTKNDVMVGNNAQTLYEHLKSLGNDPKHRQRWIWELMQNAQDVNATEIEVRILPDQLIFEHNGHPFSNKDITHLIFHGSSKAELTGKTGKFGTGFMTTHLISKTVNISGSLDDGRSFSFILNREAENAEEMAAALENSWKGFKSSISPFSQGSKTSFQYLNFSPEAEQAIRSVLETLNLLLPSVLVFCDGIKKVSIYNGGEESVYSLAALEGNNYRITCDKNNGEDPEEYHRHVRTASSQEIQVIQLAIPVDAAGALVPLDPSLPRLFITFPLIGTSQTFQLPFLINCPDFEPSPEREKVWLSADTETKDVIRNKSIIETAFQEYISFATAAVNDNRADLHLIAAIGPYVPTEWVDGAWYKKLMADMINSLSGLRLVTVAKPDAEKLPLSECFVPVSAPFGEEQVEGNPLWNICNKLFPDRIPCADHLDFWHAHLVNAAPILGHDRHPSTYDFGDLAAFIDDVDDHRLDRLVTSGITGLELIQLLVTTLEKLKLQSLWTQKALLPNQNGILAKAGVLFQESRDSSMAIDEKLKDIAELLNESIRSKLIDKTIIITPGDFQLATYSTEMLIAALQKTVRSQNSVTTIPAFEKASIQLLSWLYSKGFTDDIKGFPVKMLNGEWDTLGTSKETLLFPVSLWPEPFRPFADLFPDQFILDEQYAAIFANKNNTELALTENWLVNSPLFYEHDKIDADDLIHMVTRRSDKDTLARNDEAVWAISGDISMSNIAFINSPKGSNLLERSGEAFKWTKRMLEFILQVLLKEDNLGFTRKEITITSDNHSKTIGIYPSKWLLLLKKRLWVKNRTEKGGLRPSVEALLPHFSDRSAGAPYHYLGDPVVSRFLHFLDIGVGDLLRNIRAGDDENERTNWDQSYVALLMNEALTPEKVTSLLGDPAFIQQYELKKQQDELRAKNQSIGAAVEAAFNAVFLTLPGYKIERDPIGSDYVIETDFPHPLLIKVNNQSKFYIEIKSARSTEVRMTLTQGLKALEHKQNYVLCVVPLEDESVSLEVLVANARFITNISDLLEKRVEKVKEITDLQEKEVHLRDPASPDIWTDINGTNIRYVINRNIWQTLRPTVLTFETFTQTQLTS